MGCINSIINFLAGFDVQEKISELETKVLDANALAKKSIRNEEEARVANMNLATLLHDMNEQKVVYMHQVEKMKNRFVEIKQLSDNLKKDRDAIEIQFHESDKNCKGLLKENADLIDKTNDLSKKNLQYQDKLLTINNQKKSLQSQLEDEKIKNKQLAEEIEEVNVNITKQKTLVAGLQIIKVNLEQELQAAKIDREQLQNKLNDSNIEIQYLKKELDEAKVEIQGRTSLPIFSSEEMHLLEVQIQSLEETIQQKDSEINRLENVQNDLKNTLQQLESAYENQQQEKEYLSEKLSYSKRENISLKEKCNELEKKIQQLYVIEDKVDKVESVFEENIENDRDTIVKGNERVNNLERLSSGRKAEEAIKLSDGTIVDDKDFPEIINDSNNEIFRSIRQVYDEKDEAIDANKYFENSTAAEIALRSRILSEAYMEGHTAWKCGCCKEPVKIAHRLQTLFFIHAKRQSDVPCLWRNLSGGDRKVIVDSPVNDGKPKSQELKELIFSVLDSEESRSKGVSNVYMDKIMHGNTGYMKWRRPDISFIYQGRMCVLELQKKDHYTDFIVDRDRFYRLNGVQVLWIFGSDSDISYEYMRGLNYKETLFDNHRNVFVFDKEAQRESEKKQELILKCNWLNQNDEWEYRMEVSGCNGILVSLDQLTYDDEYCKPFYIDANKQYFENHTEDFKEYIESIIDKNKIAELYEKEWINRQSYQEALNQMRESGSRAEAFKEDGLWGFGYNTTQLIAPIFTVEPKYLVSGYYQVCVNSFIGLVDQYAQKVVDWNGVIKCDAMDYDVINQCVLFKRHGKWGVTDLNGEVLIGAKYSSIVPWKSNIYKVKEKKWGLCDINGNSITSCIYDSIGEFIDGKAEAVLVHPDKIWKTLHGYLDGNGKPITLKQTTQIDNCVIIEEFELYGLVSSNQTVILPVEYDNIMFWATGLYKVQRHEKWGIFSTVNMDFVLDIEYNSIDDLRNGKAKIVKGGEYSLIDKYGREIVEYSINLQDGWKKTMIAGKWGIENKDGIEVVKHQYDEIGSFRSRLIGVINNHIIKLDADYNYPIALKGRFVKEEEKKYILNIAGVLCGLSKKSCLDMNKRDLFDDNKECCNLAFADLIFGKSLYNLRVITERNLKKTMSKGDKDSDFSLGETLTGVVESCRLNNKKVSRLLVHFIDGRRTNVARRMFRDSKKDIASYRIETEITLRKIGFDDENDQTVWEIL